MAKAIKKSALERIGRGMRAVRPGSLVQQVGNRVFDWLNDMDTAAEVSRGALGFTDERLGMYGATSWRSVVEVRQLLHGLDISERDVFMDVGCGKGRMVCVAAQYPFARVVGVEISPELSTLARANIARNERKFRSPIVEIITADVRGSRIPDDVNVLFLNNSFVGEIFSGFMDEVTASFVRRPRLLLLIYHNPVMHDELLRRGFRTVHRSRRTHLYAGSVGLQS